MARVVWDRHTARSCVFAACAFILLSLPSAAENRVKLEIEDGYGFAGGEVTVNIFMEASPRPSAIAFWLEYDNAKLDFVDAIPGAVVTLAGKDVSWDFPSPGRVSFLIFGLNSYRIASGLVLSVTFAIDDGAKPDDEFELHGLNFSATDPSANPIPTVFDDGSIEVLQCFQPSAPTNFTATDGIFGDRVQLTWLPVFGAQSYSIYRSTTNNPSTSSVIAVTVLPFYSDFSAVPAAFGSSGAGGCGGNTGQSLQFTRYYYWVRSQNICGESGYTAAEAGWRGKFGEAAKDTTTLEALPASLDNTTTQVALRLSGKSRIAPETVIATVDSGGTEIESVSWQRMNDAGNEGWAVVTLSAPLADGEALTVNASAKTMDGSATNSTSYTFVGGGPIEVTASAVLAKSADDVVVSEVVASEAPDFVSSMGKRFLVYPTLPFASPKRVAIPVPDGVEPNEMVPHLYVSGKGWIPASLLNGWVVPESVVVSEVDGRPCVTFIANFGGLVQLGYADPEPMHEPPNWAGGLPTAVAALAIFAASALRRRRSAA